MTASLQSVLDAAAFPQGCVTSRERRDQLYGPVWIRRVKGIINLRPARMIADVFKYKGEKNVNNPTKRKEGGGVGWGRRPDKLACHMCLSVFLRQMAVRVSIAAVLWILLCPGLPSELSSAHLRLLRNCREPVSFGLSVQVQNCDSLR